MVPWINISCDWDISYCIPISNVLARLKSCPWLISHSCIFLCATAAITKPMKVPYSQSIRMKVDLWQSYQRNCLFAVPAAWIWIALPSWFFFSRTSVHFKLVEFFGGNHPPSPISYLSFYIHNDHAFRSKYLIRITNS